jgi:hypothetical protein
VAKSSRCNAKPILLHGFDELATGIAEPEPDIFVIFTSSNGYTTHENYMYRLNFRSKTDDGRLIGPFNPALYSPPTMGAVLRMELA